MATLKLAGTSFRQELLLKIFDDLWPERIDELAVELLPEPSNPYDPNAVRVVVNAPREYAGMIGYIPKSEAPKVVQALRENRVGRVRIVTLASNGKAVWATIGLAVKRTKTP